MCVSKITGVSFVIRKIKKKKKRKEELTTVNVSWDDIVVK